MLAIESSILRSINDMISIVDKQYRYVAVSHGYTQFFSLTEDEIIGKTVSELHGSEVFNSLIKSELDKTLAGENVELKFWRPDNSGQMRCIQSQHFIYTGPLTEGPGVTVVARDVTLLEETKAELEKEKAQLKNIINSIPDLIFVKDPQGAYQLCNKSFSSFLQLPIEQIIGKTDQEIMSPQSAKYIAEADRRIRDNLASEHRDEWVTYSDGRRRLLDMYKQPLQFSPEETPSVLGIGRNVTHEREAEQKQLISSLFFEAASDPYLIFNHDNELISANQTAFSQLNTLHADSNQAFLIRDLFYFPGTIINSFQELMEDKQNWRGILYSSCNQAYSAHITRVHSHDPQKEMFLVVLRDQNIQSGQADDLLSRAYHDPLTNLPNRLMLLSRLESALIRAERQLRKIAVLFIDLNKFKEINDQFGHALGDSVLIETAKRLESRIRSTDTLARFGGDEFVALLDINSTEEAEYVAQKLLESLSHPIQINGNKFIISASIGISIFPTDADDVEALLKHSDQAMYKAKRSNDYNYTIYQK